MTGQVDLGQQQLGELRGAIAALYGSNDEQRRAADMFLKAARSREGFWLLSLQLLTAPQASDQERFFAAHALRTTAQRARDLLEVEAGRSLAQELARLILGAAAAQQWAIANQLAGALAELAVRAPWWPVGSLVPEVLQLLGAGQLCQEGRQQERQQRPDQGLEPGRLQAVLVVLAALPEACQSKDISLHPDRRAGAAAALAGCAALPHIVATALGQHSAPACQLAALALVQVWGGLPGAAAALQLPPAVLAGLHQAVLASPAIATEAAETVAALYGACTPPQHPASLALLLQLLPHMEGTVGPALQAAAQQGQHGGQLLNAAITILSAAGAAVLAQLTAAAALARGGGSGGQGGQAAERQQPGGTAAAELGTQHCSAAQWWEAAGFVASCLLELLQHPDAEVALAALQPWDDALLPGLEQLLAGPEGDGGGAAAAAAAQHAQQAHQLLERLCGGLVQRMRLPAGLGRGKATADARDLPDSIRSVRRELSDTFKSAASALGSEQAVGHLLDLAQRSCAAWRAGGQPAQGWQEAESALYALNLVLPRHLAQQAQHGDNAAERAQRVIDLALELCLVALEPAAPKLAGTALTLLGGLADALAAASSSAGSGPQLQAAEAANSLLSQLLEVLLVLLECPDGKLSRNAATAVHRLSSSAGLAATLATQHAAWVTRLTRLYCSRGGLRRAPSAREDLSSEEFMLRSLCHLARASVGKAQHNVQVAPGQAAASADGPAGGPEHLLGQLVGQAAAQAAAALSQLQGQLGAPQAVRAAEAAARQCGAQLEVIAVILETAAPPGAPVAGIGQALDELWGVVQQALQYLTTLLPLEQQQQQGQQRQRQQQQPAQAQLFRLLQGSCRVVGAVVLAAPQPPVLQAALSLLLPLLLDPAHPCLLGALRALVGAAAFAAAGAVQGAANPAPAANGTHSQQQQQQGLETVLPALAPALSAALQGSACYFDDPDWAVPALKLGAAVAQQLLALVLAAGSSGLAAQLLGAAQRGAQSYHREVCEATLELATALCCCGISGAAPALVAVGGTPHSFPRTQLELSAARALDEGGAGAQLTLWLLLGASGSMPPYMVQPIAEALHRVWAVVGTERFGRWLGGAVLQLAPPDAPWCSWKPEALRAALEDLLSEPCQRDDRRFKKLLKVLCGGKKKGRTVVVPARGQMN